MTYSYQWSDGATGDTDTLTASDVGKMVSVTVTATNAGGSRSATSVAIGPVNALPAPPLVGSCPSSTANAPDGPDPFGGCFPGPETSGVPASLNLVDVSNGKPSGVPGDNAGWTVGAGGLITLTSASAVVDGITTRGGVYAPSGTGGVIENSNLGDGIDDRTASLTIRHTTIYGGSNTDYNAISAYGGANAELTVDHVNAHGGGHIIICFSNCVISNSYLHDNAPSTSAHENAILFDGGSGNTVTHNSVKCVGYCTSDIALLLNDGSQKNDQLGKNLIMATKSAAECVYPGPNYANAPHAVSGISWTDNVIQRGGNGHCDAVYGEDYGWFPTTCSPDPCTWSGNTYDDGTVWKP